MEVFVAYDVLPGPRHARVDLLHSAGFSPEGEQLLRSLFRAPPNEWGPFSFRPTSGLAPNRAALIHPSAAAAPEGPLRALDLTDRHGLCALVCDETEVLAWIGGFRPKAFTGREQFLLGALIPALIPRLRWERRFRSASVMMAGLTAALEGVPYAAFIIRDTQGILFANEAGGALLRQHPDVVLLSEAQGAPAAAPGFDLKPLRTPGLETHYLVTQTQLNVTTRVEVLRVEWQLTRRQREVLALLVQGDSNRAIASKLGCALRTAELHVSNVIRKAKVNSRTELTARFWAS
jgi:DNA-binding CsgD family transcriptional regulator